MFSLVILKRPPSVAAISSSAGAIIRQGPHQGAQKSTSTGLSDCTTSVWKVVGSMCVAWFIEFSCSSAESPRGFNERVVAERGHDEARFLLGQGREEEVRETGFLRH